MLTHFFMRSIKTVPLHSISHTVYITVFLSFLCIFKKNLLTFVILFLLQKQIFYTHHISHINTPKTLFLSWQS